VLRTRYGAPASRTERPTSRRNDGSLDGLLVIDKPVGPTSHDVVGSVRRALQMKRCGHGGTLDPPASGVLIVAVGRSTRLLRYVLDLEKSYECEVVFGTATSTLDDTGEVLEQVAMEGLSPEAVNAAATEFVGTIQQIPPMVSAVKVDGKRLYQLAREGIEIERQPREVQISRLELQPTPDPLVYRLELDCSSGTYVRSLAADLGVALGGLAHLRRLRRTSIGSFTVADAVGIDGVGPEALRPAREIVGHLRPLEVDAELFAAVAVGKVLDRRVLGATGDGPFAVVDDAGRLVAVYEASGPDRLKPAVVLVGPPEPVAQSPGN
jgi:tRNA pseudouridine55 synthase